jgi:hypothetical protein
VSRLIKVRNPASIAVQRERSEAWNHDRDGSLLHASPNSA